VDLLARRSLSEGTGMSQVGEDGIFLLKKNEKVVVFLGLIQKKNVYLQMLRHVMSERNCAVN
jgi:hypothetical protein